MIGDLLCERAPYNEKGSPAAARGGSHDQTHPNETHRISGRGHARHACSGAAAYCARTKALTRPEEGAGQIGACATCRTAPGHPRTGTTCRSSSRYARAGAVYRPTRGGADAEQAAAECAAASKTTTGRHPALNATTWARAGGAESKIDAAAAVATAPGRARAAHN